MQSFKMYHQEFEPPEDLRDVIKCFWYNEEEFGDRETCFEVIPDGYVEIIFYFGSCSTSNDGFLNPLPSPFLMGLLNQPAIFYTRKHLQIIGVRCYPWTVFDLLGLSSGRKGVCTFEHPIMKLQPVLNEYILAGRIQDAFTCVKQYFMELRSKIGVDSVLHKAGAAMREANGSIPVRKVAEEAHTTVRTLERKFKQSSGYTAKDVSGLIRFEKVRNQLWLFPASNLTGLAHEAGYTDQSHFIREFKRYSGITPAAFSRMASKEKSGSHDNFITFGMTKK